MAFAKISQVAHYVPEQVVSNDDLAGIMDTSDEWIASRSGIRERRISRRENTSDLAAQVAKRLLDKTGLSPLELDFILVATITPDSQMPSTAALVQAKIGATRAFAFDITAACSGFVFALATGQKFIASGLYGKGLVIGAETLSKTINWEDRSTAVLFGDGAGGVLLETSQDQHFLAENLQTDGNRCEGLLSGRRGLQSPFSETGQTDDFIQMNGRAIFDFAVKEVPKSILATLDMAGMTVGDIDYFLLHQANIRILDKMAKKIGADREKFPANMMHYGNTSAASIPILLAETVENGIIRLDGTQIAVLTGFGGGLTWGSLILKL